MITSTPIGIDCVTDCAELYLLGTGVTLTAAPAKGYLFVGFTGDADCTDGIVTMNVDLSCTATFGLAYIPLP